MPERKTTLHSKPTSTDTLQRSSVETQETRNDHAQLEHLRIQIGLLIITLALLASTGTANYLIKRLSTSQEDIDHSIDTPCDQNDVSPERALCEFRAVVDEFGDQIAENTRYGGELDIYTNVMNKVYKPYGDFHAVFYPDASGNLNQETIRLFKRYRESLDSLSEDGIIYFNGSFIFSQSRKNIPTLTGNKNIFSNVNFKVYAYPVNNYYYEQELRKYISISQVPFRRPWSTTYWLDQEVTQAYNFTPQHHFDVTYHKDGGTHLGELSAENGQLLKYLLLYLPPIVKDTSARALIQQARE